jgi:hypothetical protein
MPIKKFGSRIRETRNKEQPSSALAVMSSPQPVMVYRNQPTSAKGANSRIPEPQFQRIVQRHVRGESVRGISRTENRSREAVTRIVNSDEVKKIVQLMRSEVFGMAGDAVDAVRHALREQKDARVGYQLLRDIGAVPRLAEAESNAIQAMQPELEELTPYERAAAQDETGRINPIQLALVRIAEVKSAAYGFSMPTIAEMWRNRTVAALINEMTGGQARSISLSDSVELNRLKELAEDVLRGKRAMTDQEIAAVRKKYSD